MNANINDRRFAELHKKKRKKRPAKLSIAMIAIGR